MSMCRVQELGTDPQKLPRKEEDLLPGKGRVKWGLAGTTLRDNVSMLRSCLKSLSVPGSSHHLSQVHCASWCIRLTAS